MAIFNSYVSLAEGIPVDAVDAVVYSLYWRISIHNYPYIYIYIPKCWAMFRMFNQKFVLSPWS